MSESESEPGGEPASAQPFRPTSEHEPALEALPEDLRDSLRQLTDEHDRMLLVLTAIHDGVIALDAHGRITLMNRTTEELFAIPTGSWFQRPLRDVIGNRRLNEFARLAQRGDIGTENLELASRGKTLQVYAARVRQRERSTQLVLVIRDVTEMRRLENMRRDFVANVSHELKTPLTSIQAYVETLIDGGLSDAEVNERFIRKIEENATRLSTLITDLLTLSRIESGKAVTHRAAVDAAQVVGDSAQRLNESAETKDISLAVDFESERLEILGESEALHQIFDNLITNAITYTEPGGSVTVRAWLEDPWVVFTVSDTGIGIPSDDLPRIFERFYRVDKARSRKKGGTGLGLSIVKHYVEALEGEVDVDSEIGAGTTFTVKIPTFASRGPAAT